MGIEAENMNDTTRVNDTYVWGEAVLPLLASFLPVRLRDKRRLLEVQRVLECD